MSIQLTDKTAFAIYSPDLKEITILKVFETRHQAFAWGRDLIERYEVSYDTTTDLTEHVGYVAELMEKNFNIIFTNWKWLKKAPSIYGPWDPTSLWAFFNHDLSEMTDERWLKLEQEIDFPIQIEE